MKSLLAEEAGAAALLLYPERRDLGIVKPDFPAGPYLNPWTVQRGSMLRYFLRPGDPDCPACGALARLRPALPALPVSESVAKELLGRVEGPPAPRDWTGWLDVPYRLGATRETVRLRTRSRTEARVLRNVTAVLAGRRREAGVVVVGAHTDAWVNGAVDPVSGVAAVLETAAALSALAREGWKPERDVVFALFDGEEYGMLGSTLWVEERLAAHAPRMAAFLFVDSSVRALDFMADVSPGMRESLDEVLGHVADPVSGRVLLSVRGVRSCPASAATRRRSSASAGSRRSSSGSGGAPIRNTTRRTTIPTSSAGSSIPATASARPSRASSRSSHRCLPGRPTRPGAFPRSPRSWRTRCRSSRKTRRSRRPPASCVTASSSRRCCGCASRPGSGNRSMWRGAASARRRPSRSFSTRWPRFTRRRRPSSQRRNLLLGPSAETGCGTETLPGLRRALHGDGSVEDETARLLRALATAAAKLREAVRIASAS